MINNLSRKSSFRRFYNSYIIVSLCLILISIPIVSVLNYRAFSQERELNKHLINEFKYSTDEVLLQLTNSVYDVLDAEGLNSLPQKKDLMDADYYESMSFCKLLSKLKAKYKNLKTLAVYISDYDIVVSQSGVYSAKTFFHTAYLDSDILNNYFENLRSGKTLFIVDSKSKKYLFYDFNCKSLANNDKNIIIFSCYDLSSILTKMDNMYNYSYANIVMHNDNYNLTISNDNFSIESINKIRFKKYISISSSVDSNWTYYLTPNSSKYNPMSQLTLLTFLTIIFQLVIMLILGFIISNMQYAPITNIIKIFSKNNIESNIKLQDDDYKYITENISKLINDNNNYIQKSYDTNLFKALHDIFYNRYFDEDINFIKEHFSENEFYFVVLITPDENSLSVLKNNNYTEKNIDIIFKNIIEEMFYDTSLVEVFPIKNYYCCIINTQYDSTDIVVEKLLNAQKFILHYFNVNFNAVVSGCVKEPHELSKCFTEDENLIMVLNNLSENSIAKCDEFSSEYIDSAFNSTVKNKIFNCVNNNQPEEAYNIFETSLNLSLENMKTVNIVNKIYFETISLLSYIVDNSIPEEDLVSNQKFSPSQCILSCNSFLDLKHNVQSYFSLLCSYLFDDSQAAKSDSDSMDIIQYINDNYMNPKLNASMLCEKYKISPSALSLMFKKTFNIGMNDYITSLKLNKAKYYLNISDKSLGEIALLVGYNNARSFSRAFKRVEGISPGQYRENNNT